jgi:hypothetical protein
MRNALDRLCLREGLDEIMIDEKQKKTTELYRLNYLITLDKNATPDEVRKAKLRVNEIRGFEFYKDIGKLSTDLPEFPSSGPPEPSSHCWG